MIVAIDGPAGAGKSTVARAVADSLGFRYLDTGALYRAVTLAALEGGVDISDPAALARLAQSLPLEATPGSIRVAGRDVTREIRSQPVTDAVSQVAADPSIRAALIPFQRDLAASADAVLEGRDIGTAVFPDAEVKIFLTATSEERARRRTRDMDLPEDNATVREMKDTIERRDAQDSSRDHSPLVRAADAIDLDTSAMSFAQVVDAVVEIVERARERG